MQVKTQEAPLLNDKKQQILNLIPQFEIRPIFLREHLKRELVIGTVGDRGGGKSASDAVIGFTDFMLAGKPVWSNMEINVDIAIDDATAQKYGLNSGGVAHYRSQPLVKDALLELDESYMDGLLLIEEINVQYANARKFNTNTNMDFNMVCQQLRKFRTSLIYNVIDEMFIDVQLRTLTDVFIRTYDTAFSIDNLYAHKDTGLDFKWSIYPMTGYLAGTEGSYAITHKPLPPVYFHFANWRGIYNTMKYQEKGTYSMSKKDKALQAQVSVESSPEMTKTMAKWQWLQEAAQDLRNAGQKFLRADELAQWIGQPLTREIKGWLAAYGIHWNSPKQGYIIEQFTIDGKLPKSLSRALVTA